MSFGDCETLVNFPIIVLSEKRSRFVMMNPRQSIFRKILVDGCAITDGPRCDYLVIGPDDAEYFVELKGCDIRHAIQQLETSIQNLGSKIVIIKRFSYIISTRCPLQTPKIQELQIHFKRVLKSTLLIKNNNCEIDV